jgi:ankyrin repeat protein
MAWAGALHEAIDTGDVAQVKAILTKDPSMATHPAADDGDIMPLAWAATRGDVAIIDLLLAAGADIEKGGPVSPLGFAAYSGQLAAAKELLDKGASPKTLTAKKVSTLHLAARGSVRTVTKVGGGAENYSYAPNTDIAALLLRAGGVSPSATDASGQTPLHEAAANGNPGIVSQLLAAKVPVDVRTVNGLTPLHYASLQGNRVIAKNGKWQTIKYYSNAEAARVLLAAGADVNAVTQDENKLTPLMMAAARGLDDVVKVLLEAKPDVDKKSADGKTALHFAADSILLVQARVLGDNEQQEMDTVFPTQTIDALLKAGASRTAKDKDGHVPADLARNHEPEIVKLLKVSK